MFRDRRGGFSGSIHAAVPRWRAVTEETLALSPPWHLRLRLWALQPATWTQVGAFLAVGAVGYAVNLAAYGAAVHGLAIDYRTIGSSEGEPRCQWIPEWQVADTRAGVSGPGARAVNGSSNSTCSISGAACRAGRTCGVTNACCRSCTGRSAANETSNSAFLAMARRQLVTARLNGSVGDSFAVAFGLLLEDMSR